MKISLLVVHVLIKSFTTHVFYMVELLLLQFFKRAIAEEPSPGQSWLKQGWMPTKPRVCCRKHGAAIPNLHKLELTFWTTFVNNLTDWFALLKMNKLDLFILEMGWIKTTRSRSCCSDTPYFWYQILHRNLLITLWVPQAYYINSQ